jgi:hypothetical protein
MMSVVCFTQTIVYPGDVHGTFDIAGSPYVIPYGSISVPVGETLTIEPGVVLDFRQKSGLIVQGALTIVGSLNNEVILTTTDPEVPWSGITIENTSGILISYAEFSRYGVDTALKIVDSSDIVVQNSKFINNWGMSCYVQEYDAIALHAIRSAKLDFSKNYFRNNALRDGLSHFDKSVIRFDDCTNVLFYANNVIYNFSDQTFVVENENIPIPLEYFSISLNNFKYNKQRIGTVFVRNNEPITKVTIHSNQISYNTIDHDSLGASQYSSGLNIIGQNFDVIGNTMSHNTGAQGGGLYVGLGGQILVERNQIFRNSAHNGGGIYIVGHDQDTSVQQKFFRNQVFENHAGHGGALVVIETTIPHNWNPPFVPIDFNQISTGFFFLEDSFIHNYGYSSAINVYGDLALINCIVADNGGYGMDIYNQFSNYKIATINSVFWGNSGPDQIHFVSNPPTPFYVFSIIEGGPNGINIPNVIGYPLSADPMFVDKYGLDWRPTNPFYITYPPLNSFPPYFGLDPYDPNVYSVDNRTFTGGNPAHLHWVSFPKLNQDPYSNAGVNFFDTAPNINFSGFFETGMNSLTHQLTTAVFIPPLNFWVGDMDVIKSTHGYKLSLSNDATVYIPAPTIYPNTRIELFQNTPGNTGNWIGYFLPRTVSLFDAFSAEALENIISIESRHGAIHFPGGIRSSRQIHISYGEMVVVHVHNDTDFYWEWGTELPSYLRSGSRVPSLFEFVELPDYKSIYIEVDPANPPDEIAVFVDGVCRGAKMYEGQITEILAYLHPSDFGKEIEVRFGYYEDWSTRRVDDFAIVNIVDGSLQYIPMIARHSTRYYHLKFDIKDSKNAEMQKPFIQLQQNYPNPFNPTTRIDFYISTDDKASLSIYNIRGQKVKELVSGPVSAGKHSVIWDGTDSNNRNVGSGVYFYRLQTNHGTSTHKMLLIK